MKRTFRALPCRGIVASTLSEYEWPTLCLQGSEKDKELDEFTEELNHQWYNKGYNPDAVINYYLDNDASYIVFVVFSDPYSGLVRYASKIPISDLTDSKLNAATFWRNLKSVKSDDAHAVAFEWCK